MENEPVSPDGRANAAAVEQLRARLRQHPPAHLDPGFLARAERRALRLENEYLRPELAFAERGVEHAIVVFGSTRMHDPERSAARLAGLEAAAARGEPGAAGRARAERDGSRYYEIGRELGRLVGHYGRGPADSRLVVMTGAGPGGMEAANRGAHEVGAASAGLNIRLPSEQRPNPWVTPELCFEFRYFALRKLHFMLRARALVALPGGYGTLDELFETLCLVQTGKRAPLPVVLVGEAFWRRLIDFDFLRSEGMIDPGDLELFEFAETAQETWDRILAWYAARNTSIFDASR